MIGFFVSLCSWLGLEFAERDKPEAAKALPPELSPNDLRLGRRLREAFPPHTRRFLREHSFGQVFHESRVKPLEDLCYDWRGAAYEFDDYELRLTAAAVVTDVNDLLDKMNTYSGVADRYPPGNYSIPTDPERARDTFTDLTQKRIEEVDKLAGETLEQFENFEREFRSKAPAEFA
ncbi:hypothetical protein NPA31_005195 [Aurantimonas sp. MSK8Z-1]|nr:hypothetical protein [Aurantimonas sp. MSK8Z-1]